ncbi:Dabb family protein [Onishia taeanensis]
MIKHIVLWTLHEQAEGRTKAENAAQAKRQLEALNGRIEGLLSLEVGIDLLHTSSSADLSLLATFASLEALEAYQQHPEHQALMPFMAAIRHDRRVIDYAL